MAMVHVIMSMVLVCQPLFNPACVQAFTKIATWDALHAISVSRVLQSFSHITWDIKRWIRWFEPPAWSFLPRKGWVGWNNTSIPPRQCNHGRWRLRYRSLRILLTWNSRNHETYFLQSITEYDDRCFLHSFNTGQMRSSQCQSKNEKKSAISFWKRFMRFWEQCGAEGRLYNAFSLSTSATSLCALRWAPQGDEHALRNDGRIDIAFFQAFSVVGLFHKNLGLSRLRALSITISQAATLAFRSSAVRQKSS